VNACCRRETTLCRCKFRSIRSVQTSRQNCSLFRLIFLVTVVMATLKSCKYIVIPRISATTTVGLILLTGYTRSYILAPNDTSYMTLSRLYFPSFQRYCGFCMPTASFSYPTPVSVRLFWLKFRDVSFGVHR